jgi:tetratricopeptide (TPR) repeat protein
MPARFPTAPAACALVIALCSGMLPAAARTPTAAALSQAAAPVENSGLDAALFYQLLIGELELSAKDPGSAYSVMLDAARKSKNEQVFRRATEIALQARSGDLALKAAQAWKTALPASLEANRYVVQLLVALNRSAEAAEPLRSMIALSPPGQRAALITSLPRFFERAGDRQRTPTLLESALQPYVDQPETRVASLVAIGRAAQGAGDTARALELAQRAHAFEPSAPAPVLLALDLLPGTADAEPIVLGHLQVQPQANAIRLFYARVLAVSQRHAEALVQIEQVTRHAPELAAPWLTLGALHLELHQPRQATAALETYLRLVRARMAPPATLPATANPHAAADTADIEDDEAALAPDRGTAQAMLMLAQAAEQTGDFRAAESWLNQIESPKRALEVQLRRASLLARQGRLAEALALVRSAPEATEDEARSKVLAEVQLLRENKLWQQADQTLDKANLRFVNDPDLLYEQAMMTEKLDRIDDMERLLRRVIALRPDYYHAHNALGYSLADRGLRLPEAKALIERALELAPGEPFITDSLGWVEYRMGDRVAAIKHLTQAYQARPDADIAAHLGEVLWMDGQREEARRVLVEGKARDASSEALRETLIRLKVDL